MKRGIAAAALAALALGAFVPTASGDETPPLTVDEPSIATEVSPNKIDVMGIWAHPDDDASFTTPCGVWHDRYDVQCGVIMLTRGEGGSNSVGDEQGPALGLRRENEDRTSHYRSGTVDIYNIDAVDFFYNTSAALTEDVWGSERVQRQVVHVIRQTQPEILTGFSPSLASGHGHHQYAGRVVWEAAQMAADPTAFPEQLTGPDAVDVWQVKTITSGASTQGEGGTAGPGCNDGFVPAPTNPFTVVGTWSGYDSPYTWLPGNVQGQEPGTAQTWAQVGREGNRAHPTQARVKHTGIWEPQCLRYGIAESRVPFQPNGSPENARDDAILFGSVIADPGGMPLGSTYDLVVDGDFQAPGEPFEVTVNARSGAGTIGAGAVTLDVPVGWAVSDPQDLGPVTDGAQTSATFTVTPTADATPGRYKLSAFFDNGAVTAYNDTRIDLVPGVEGRFERWGNYAEYEEWAEEFTWVGGRSGANWKIGAGETISVPVVVTNRTSEPQSGEVSAAVEAPLEISEPATFTDIAPGAETTVTLTLTHTDPTSLGLERDALTVPITTTSGAGTSTDAMTLVVVPTTVIPELDTAPSVDGAADDAYGAALDVSRRWEGADCAPDGVDCGTGSYARAGWHGDDLYLFVNVVDDVASAAATPERCFGHWLVDSVEVLLDPLGGSRDTSTTFKTGIMPVTDDPTGAAGQGPDGPCWSRDADAHQGFSSGPLADLVEEGPNAPGQEVAVDVDIAEDGTYAGGAYTIEVKIPLGNLPAGFATSAAPTGDAATNEIDPDYLGFNVTPYDSDNQDFIGDTRLAWSPWGSQQSEPFRWGHAYLDGYTPPEGRPTEPQAPIIPDTALLGVESPQTIHQSATRGVTISGLPASRAMTVDDIEIDEEDVAISVTSTEPGTVRAFLWHGQHEIIPVWVSSCEGDEYGFSACSPEDGEAAPWAPDMGGRLLGAGMLEIEAGGTLEIGIDAATHEALREDGSILISFQSEQDEVNAWHYPVIEGELPTEEPTEEPTTDEPTEEPTTPAPTDGPTTPGAPTTPPAGGGPGGLPSTGANVGTVALVALLLALAGGGTALAVRHRRTR
ncbi:PIG-L family deacetylase [Georgenia satyanarayanai]|uniref:PIG-L family deacetylase n=1 Tax=Georgenia satyanarayanai TaxID=860221 RepID=UPI00186ABD80|nr:PIG-L family deacetylase [Georgenia satyanarayanai]